MTYGGGWRIKRLASAFGLLLSLAAVSTALCSSAPRFHEVRQGDTLWDLSGFYYGDHSLWPKLWEMNPFVTNPHLLKEGDVLKLMETPLPKPPVEPEAPPEPVSLPPVLISDRSFDVSSLVDEAYAGFFSFEAVSASGSLIAGETTRVLLAGGDAVFVKLASHVAAAPGDSFMVYRIAGRFADPGDGKRCGYAVSFKGKVVLFEEVQAGVFHGTIEDAVESISVGDTLMTVPPVQPCISVKPPANSVEGAVIASRHGRKLIGRLDVVYLNRGRRDGLDRGNLLRIHLNATEIGSWLDSPLPLPPLGSLIVLAVTTDSATALVLDARRDIPAGAAVSTVDGEHLEALVSALPACRPGGDARKTLD